MPRRPTRRARWSSPPWIAIVWAVKATCARWRWSRPASRRWPSTGRPGSASKSTSRCRTSRGTSSAPCRPSMRTPRAKMKRAFSPRRRRCGVRCSGRFPRWRSSSSRCGRLKDSTSAVPSRSPPPRRSSPVRRWRRTSRRATPRPSSTWRASRRPTRRAAPTTPSTSAASSSTSSPITVSTGACRLPESSPCLTRTRRASRR